ncbi:MAG: ComEC/Rec2 family competence protein, partial [Bacteroidota bacterium]
MPEHPTVGGLLSSRPAIRLTLAVAIGILVSDALALTPSHACVLLSASLLAAWFFRNRFRLLADLILLLALSFLGMSWHAERSRAAADRRPGPSDPESPIPMTIRILDPPVRSARTWTCTAEATVPANAPVITKELRARVLLPMAALVDSARDPKAGELWRIEGSIDPFPRPRNPGEFDYGAYLSLGGVDAVIRAARASPAPEESQADRHAWLGTTQGRLYRAIDALHSGERAAFLKGVILGYRADLGDELKQAFLMTGTVHILAVSGGNVALVAGVAMVLFGVLRFRRRTVGLLAIGAVVGYMWVTGSSPSVVRATIMAIVVLAGTVVGRRTDVFQSLSVAALVLLLGDPRTLFDPGFQLSFVSVLAIVVGVPLFNRALERWPEEIRDQPHVRATAQLAAISLAAQVGTLPLTLGMFGQVSIVAVLANLAVVPLSGVALILGVIELLLVPLVPWVAGVYATVNDQVMNVLLGLVRAAAGVPWAAVETGRPDVLAVWAAYAFLGAVASGALPPVRRSLIMIGLLLANASVWSPLFDHSPHELEVLTLDVGQGDAHIIRTPSGKTVLIDTGPSEFAAERIILPAVKRLG